MKDNFVFCDARYLDLTLKQIDSMNQSTLQEIVDKYIEINIALDLWKAMVDLLEYG